MIEMEEISTICLAKVVDIERAGGLLRTWQLSQCTFPYQDQNPKSYNLRIEGRLEQLKVHFQRLAESGVLGTIPLFEFRSRIGIPDYSVGLVVGKDGSGLTKMRRATGIFDVRGLYKMEGNPGVRLLVQHLLLAHIPLISLLVRSSVLPDCFLFS